MANGTKTETYGVSRYRLYGGRGRWSWRSKSVSIGKRMNSKYSTRAPQTGQFRGFTILPLLLMKNRFPRKHLPHFDFPSATGWARYKIPSWSTIILTISVRLYDSRLWILNDSDCLFDQGIGNDQSLDWRHINCPYRFGKFHNDCAVLNPGPYSVGGDWRLFFFNFWT